jgi:hypothetical protein
MRPLFVIFLTGVLSASAETRRWTDEQERTVEADFVRVEGENVILKLKSGTEASFPLAKLSASDREYVKSQAPSAEDNATNFDRPWPERVTFGEDPEIAIIEEDAEKKSFIYESANYRYVSDVRLSKSVVKGFAVLFEATNLYCATLPLGLNGGSPPSGKHLIYLFETYSDYLKAGGLEGTAGIFLARSTGENRVIAPLESLGVRPVGSGYMLDRDKSSHVLPHELTHQLTPPVYFGNNLLGWFFEGLSEYVAITPYRSGSFNVRSNLDTIIEYATGYGTPETGGRALGKKIHLPALETFMAQDYQKFSADTTQINYGFSLLLTTYFFHFDGKGDAARIKSFLKALREKKTLKQAYVLLLDGRTYEQLESEVANAWNRKGIDLIFAKKEN